MNTRSTLATALLLAFIPHSFFLNAQGPLTPPGAPAPTMKTLDQIEAKLEKRTPISSLPTTIGASGSYYLTADLTGAAGLNGITVNADDVTIDLNGFVLTGIGTSLNAILINGVHGNIRVTNGVLRNWPSGAVAGTSCKNTEVSHLRISTSGSGIQLAGGANVHDCVIESGTVGINTGTHSIVQNCISLSNTTTGIHVSDGSTISQCNTNGGAGISTGDGCTVTVCTVISSTGAGFDVGNDVSLAQCSTRIAGTNGFTALARCTLIGCMAESSDARGIQTGIGCTVADCQTSNSVGVGIFTSDRSVVRHSVGNFNGEVGIQVGQGCVVVGCTAVSNGTNAAATSRDGIKCSTAGTIVDCTAQNNQANGIATSQGSTVSRCTASGTFSDGIEVTTDCRVLENTCDGNGSGGIDVDAIGNLIVRNSASGNTTNYDIVANKRYGVVVDLTAVGPPLVSGNSAASTLATTDPWANTAY